MNLRALIIGILLLAAPLVSAAIYIPDCDRALLSEIMDTQTRIKTADFTTDRGLQKYEESLGSVKLPKILSELKDLSYGSVWLDLGSGEAKAMRDFLRDHRNSNGLKLVAVSFAKPDGINFLDDLKKFRNALTYIESGLLEEALAQPNHPIHAYMGRVKFLTEVFGPTAYMHDISMAFNLVADLLSFDGEARIRFTHQTHFFRNGVHLRRSEIPEIIKAMTGGRLKVVKMAANGIDEIMVLRKATGIKGPSIQPKLIDFTDGGPPRRVYEIP